MIDEAHPILTCQVNVKTVSEDVSCSAAFAAGVQVCRDRCENNTHQRSDASLQSS